MAAPGSCLRSLALALALLMLSIASPKAVARICATTAMRRTEIYGATRKSVRGVSYIDVVESIITGQLVRNLVIEPHISTMYLHSCWSIDMT